MRSELISTHNEPVFDKAVRTKYYSRALALAIFTIIYNLAEGVISTLLGYQDESLALFGFGVDSFIETISGIGIAHMVMRIKSNNNNAKDEFEIRALKITGWGFYALTAGLTLTAIFNIIQGKSPETTFWGVVISSVSIGIMIYTIKMKEKAGTILQSDAIIADAKCARVCVYMSVVLLASSLLYELTHFIYLDSLGALGLAWFSLNEGKECFEKAKGKVCTDCCH